MGMHQLGRETDVVGHHHARTPFIGLEVRIVGQAYLYAASGEQRVPEREVLVHVQAARDAEGQHRMLHLPGRTAEKQIVLEVIGIRARLFLGSIGKHLFAPVARIIVLAVGKAVTEHLTLVVAPPAMEFVRRIVGLRQDVVQRHFPLPIPAGIQGATEGSHQLGDVAPDDLRTCQQLERTDHRVVAHGSTLHHDVPSQLRNVLQFQYLVETVLHDRIGQTGSDVVYRRPFAEHLLHLGVHEHGTPRTQVARTGGTAGRRSEVVRRIAQSIGKRLDERAAPRRTGFVDFDAVDDAVVHKDGLHVLAANVEDEGDIPVQVVGSHVMGNGLHDAGIQLESGLYQVFTIAGGATALDMQDGTLLTAPVLEQGQTVGYRLDGMPAIRFIIGKQEIAIRINHNNLCGRRTRVNAQEHVLDTLTQGSPTDTMGRDAFLPAGIVAGTGEYRLQAARMTRRSRRFGQPGYQGRQFEGFVFLSPRQGSPRSRQQGTVGRKHHFVLAQMEVFGKGLAKRRDEGQRTAAEQDRRLDVPSMGQRHHRLDGHGMENGGRDVFTADVPGHQILDIGLAEDSATRSNRIDTPGLQGQPVEFVDIGTQNDGHLVDERPCPSGAVAVHAQVGRFAVFEEDNLGILSSDVDHGRYLRIILLDSLRGGHHFLNERD